MKSLKSQGIDAVLREVYEARETDYRAVDFAEGFEAEDFCCVVS